MKKTFILFLTTYILSASKCKKDESYPFFIRNRDNQDVAIILSYLTNEYNLYPDTTLTVQKPLIRTIKAQSFKTYDRSTKWDLLYEYLPADTMSLYFFDPNSLSNYSWDTIRSRYLILQRYDLSLKDLENRKFEIEYPYDPSRGKLKVWKP